MSQLVACVCEGGVVLAADRRVVLERDGESREHTVRKVYPLGPSAAVATSGAAVGIWVSRVLSRLLRRRGAPPFRDLEAYALSVFQKEYDEFVRQGARWFAAHPEAHRLSYVLLAGRGEDGSFGYRFYASEAHGEPYRPLRTTTALTAPRRLGLEAALARTGSAPGGCDTVVATAVEGLRRVAARDPHVGGPFDVAWISDAGVRFRTFEG